MERDRNNTHNLAQARRIGDYAALFWVQAEVGRLIEYGTVEQIFTAPQYDLTAAYVISCPAARP